MKSMVKPKAIYHNIALVKYGDTKMSKSDPTVVRELLNEYASKKKKQMAGFVHFAQRQKNTRDDKIDSAIEAAMDAELKKMDLFKSTVKK